MKFTSGASFAAAFAHAPILPAVTPIGLLLDTEKRAANVMDQRPLRRPERFFQYFQAAKRMP
jgi:hypothetical protein